MPRIHSARRSSSLFILGVGEKQAYPNRCRNFDRFEDEMLEEGGSDSSTLVSMVDSHTGE